MPLAELRRSGFARIAFAFSALLSLSLLALVIILEFWVAKDVGEQLREAIEQDVRELADIYGSQGLPGLQANLHIMENSIEASRSLYWLTDRDGRALAGNIAVKTMFEGWRKVPFVRIWDSPDHFLIFGTRLGDLHLYVGRRTHAIWDVQESVLKSFGFALLFVIPIMIFGSALVARRTFARVQRITDSMGAFAKGQLSTRAPVTGIGDEIDGLAIGINANLEKIEKLMSDLSQVTNDIAHDLRTPLSRLRQRLDLACCKARTTADFQDALNESMVDIDGLLGTFDAMLQIAEIDSGSARKQFRTESLSRIALDLADIYADVAEDAGKTFSHVIEPDVSTCGNRHLLTQLLSNLIENAIRHTAAGTAIELKVCSESTPSVYVSDNGTGIPEDEREHVFQRFYRLDSSRTRPGNGFGLSLAKSIADLHGAQISLEAGKPGLIVKVTFPSTEPGK